LEKYEVPIFSEDQVRQLEQEYFLIAEKQKDLVGFFTSYNFSNEKATEYARHGYLRRLYTIVHCIESVFQKIPPDLNEIPSRETTLDATIALQAFVFNIFGIADNLAWIWATERNLRRPGGELISAMQIGLRSKNEIIRKSFSDEFQQYLYSLDEWFEHLENFRHALAHRIPLYIPPYCVVQENLETYLSLEGQSLDALKRGDISEHERLTDEQKRLRVFQPIMKHSFIDSSRSVVFHAQMLADFNTVHEISQKFIAEIKAARDSSLS
jgi:hypothetical protein